MALKKESKSRLFLAFARYEADLPMTCDGSSRQQSVRRNRRHEVKYLYVCVNVNVDVYVRYVTHEEDDRTNATYCKRKKKQPQWMRKNRRKRCRKSDETKNAIFFLFHLSMVNSRNALFYLKINILIQFLCSSKKI